MYYCSAEEVVACMFMASASVLFVVFVWQVEGTVIAMMDQSSGVWTQHSWDLPVSTCNLMVQHLTTVSTDNPN